MADLSFISPLSSSVCVDRLEEMAANRSFYAQTGHVPVQITFTQLNVTRAENNHTLFRLKGRCTRYRGVGILYMQVKGRLEPAGTVTKVHFSLGLGTPTDRTEWLFQIGWHLLLLAVGGVLIFRGVALPAGPAALHFAFLPMVYLLYSMALYMLYQPAAVRIPSIIHQTLSAEPPMDTKNSPAA